MPVQFNAQAIIDKNKSAISAATKSIARLKKIRQQGLFPDDENDVEIQLSRALNERTELKDINSNLQAGQVTVSPMNDALATQLNALGNKLEQQIQTDQIIGATLDFVTTVLDDVSKIRSIVSSKTA
jgi:hypothetical protein